MNEEYYFIYNGDFSLVTGNYQWVSEIMENLGTSLEDYKEGKYVLLNEEQTSFLKEHDGITPEEAWNMTTSDTATSVDIAILVGKIEDYYSSADVKTFYVNGTPIWFDSEKRILLTSSISMEKEVGKETTILWVDGVPYTMSVDDARQMMIDIEMYSMACFNNEQTNIAEAKALTLKSEIRDFDITKGYPEKLSFNL